MLIITLNGLLTLTLSVSLNILRLYFTFKHTPPLLKPYATVIRFHCTTDIISELVNGATYMVYIAIDGVVFSPSLGPLEYWFTPQTINYASIAYAFFVLYAPCATIPIDR